MCGLASPVLRRRNEFVTTTPPPKLSAHTTPKRQRGSRGSIRRRSYSLLALRASMLASSPQTRYKANVMDNQSALSQQIRDRVNRERLVDTAVRLISVPSPTGDAGNVSDALADMLAGE